MWSFIRVAAIEKNDLSPAWYAVLTLKKDGIEESFRLKYWQEPTMSQAEQAGVDLANKKNNEA
jgi:hypothetical protein